MKKVIVGAIALSLLATPALARVKVRDLLLGGVVGAVVMDAVHEAKEHPSYSYDYNSTYYRNDPCYYTAPEWLIRSNPEQAEYERGKMARLCQEQQERKQRAFECGYSGNCR
jgi:hypothetical protein